MNTKYSTRYTALGTGILAVGFLGIAYLFAQPNVQREAATYRQATNAAALDVTYKAFTHIVRAGFTRTEHDPHARFGAVDNQYLSLVNLQCKDLLKWRNVHSGMVSPTYQKMLDDSLEECIKLGKTAMRRPIIYNDLHAMANGMRMAMEPATSLQKAKWQQDAQARVQRLSHVPKDVQAMSTWSSPQ